MKYFVIVFFATFWQTMAQSDVPLSLRAQFNGSYGYTIIGNTLNQIDNRFDNPPPPCQLLTESNAVLNIMSNQTVVAAYLYWSGVEDGVLNPIIALNGIEYLSSSTFVAYPETNLIVKYFGSFVNITNQIIAGGNGLYTFSNLNLNPLLGNYCGGGAYYGGWHIVVVYNDVSLPNQQLNIYDGFNIAFDQFNNGVTPFSVNNIDIIDNQNANLSYVAYNGSTNLFFNESITLNGNILSNALNPANNPFNGTNSFTGSTTNWNQDIDTFDISPFINIGDTQANFTLNSTFFRAIQTVVTSIRSELPDATVQINQVNGQEICNNLDLTVNYSVANTNSNAVLQVVPVSFYANNVLLQTVNTTGAIAIGGSLSLQTNITIPSNIPNTFELKIIVDNSTANLSTISESNENNNDNIQNITLVGNTIAPTFNLSNSFCQGATVPDLPTTSINNISGTWLPSVISNQNSGSYVFTPNANQCANGFTLNTTILQSITPTFNLANTFCAGANVPVLPTTSSNFIAGTWLPSVISNQNSGTYVFTPNANQCALPFNLNVTITPKINLTFNIANTFCAGANVPVLPTTSSNSIAGTWLPSVISNQNSGTYVFTPNVNQCATGFTLNVAIQTINTVNENLFVCKDNFNTIVAPAVLNTNLTATIYTFVWSNNNFPINQTSSFISVVEPGNYQVVATPNNLSCSQIFNFDVANLQPLTTKYTISEDFAYNQSVLVQASGGSGNYSYSFNNLPFQENPIFASQESGDIIIKTKDDSNCYETSQVVTLWQYPRFFTPNNDGFNDTWGINTNKNIKIDIFDRFGKLIKQIKTGESWNGSFKSQLLPANDYWFVIDYNENITFRGHFALKR